MAIIYKCKHCKHVIGEIGQHIISTSMLGWDQLSVREREKMIQYKENGDVHVQTICENCEESLGQHPAYYELDYFLQ